MLDVSLLDVGAGNVQLARRDAAFERSDAV
jgi:hypothetical protein